MLVRKLDEQFEGFARKHRSSRIMRRIDQDESGTVRDRCAQVVVVGLKVRRPKRYGHVASLAKLDHRAVRIVKRFESDHFVALDGQRQNGGRECFGSAGGHQNLPVSIHAHSVEPLLVGGNRVAQHWHAERGRVLVGAVRDGMAGGLQNLHRTVFIGEALPQVDRARACGKRRHFAENGLAQLPISPEQHGTPGCPLPRSRYAHPSSLRAGPVAAPAAVETFGRCDSNGATVWSCVHQPRSRPLRSLCCC